MSRLDQINTRIQQLKSGHLDQQGKSELATLYTQRQKEMLNEQIRQELIAKNTGTPTPKKGEPETSIHITGLSVEKQDKTES